MNERDVKRFCQVLKGAVGTTLRENEAELKISMEIDHQNSSIDQTGKIRLVSSVSLVFPVCSVNEIWWKFPLEIILLPHSGRGSRLLLLSRTDTFVVCCYLLPGECFLLWHRSIIYTLTVDELATCCKNLVDICTSYFFFHKLNLN